jgi:DNA-binding NarL/FixJ family response regulator
LDDLDQRVGIAEIARRLAVHETGLADALGAIRDAVSADRASIAAIREDAAGSYFEIIVARGEALLQPGTRFPIEVSTHHSRVAEGASFVSTNFDRLRGFSRPVDRVVRAHGFRSGAALALTQHANIVGVLNLHFNAEGARVEAAVSVVAPIAGALAAALASHRIVVTRVLVCHDDPILGRGIARLLEEQASALAVVARTIDAAVDLAADSDVIVCDHAFGGPSLHGFLNRLQASGLGLPIVVTATRTTASALAAAAAAEAVAFIAHADLELALVPQLTAIATNSPELPTRSLVSSPSLTRRELEVIAALDRGLRLAQVARELGISDATVKTHVRNLFRKLGATSRSEATFIARRLDLIRE